MLSATPILLPLFAPLSFRSSTTTASSPLLPSKSVTRWYVVALDAALPTLPRDLHSMTVSSTSSTISPALTPRRGSVLDQSWVSLGSVLVPSRRRRRNRTLIDRRRNGRRRRRRRNRRRRLSLPLSDIFPHVAPRSHRLGTLPACSWRRSHHRARRYGAWSPEHAGRFASCRKVGDEEERDA
eukprot:4891643-Pyramimonas_sp.AAC.1